MQMHDVRCRDARVEQASSFSGHHHAQAQPSRQRRHGDGIDTWNVSERCVDRRSLPERILEGDGYVMAEPRLRSRQPARHNRWPAERRVHTHHNVQYPHRGRRPAIRSPAIRAMNSRRRRSFTVVSR